MNNIISYEDFLLESKVDDLAGIVIIVNNKILLVQPRKFKKYDDKWSIPKGHVEKKQKNFDTALKELEEETGIKLSKDFAQSRMKNKSIIYYRKSGTIKKLKYFVIIMSKEELIPYLRKNKNQIKKNYYRSKEIYDVKFFKKKNAEKLIEDGQFSILKELL